MHRPWFVIVRLTCSCKFGRADSWVLVLQARASVKPISFCWFSQCRILYITGGTAKTTRLTTLLHSPQKALPAVSLFEVNIIPEHQNKKLGSHET